MRGGLGGSRSVGGAGGPLSPKGTSGSSNKVKFGGDG